MVAEDVLFAELEFEPAERTTDETKRIYRTAIGRLKALPAVEESSGAGGIPFMSGSIARLFVPGLDSLPSGSRPWIDAVWPGYFSTMGSALVSGRDFNETDDARSTKVTIVNETMARALWGADDPLGKCLKIGSADAECAYVVGVVGNRRYHTLLDPEWVYFLPMEQAADFEPIAVFVRGRGDSQQLAAAVRRELVAGVPGVRYAVVQPLQDIIDPKLHHFRLGAGMFTVFGLLALVVAGLGLFSVLAFNVSQRTHEIGVRTALGASRHGIIQLIVRQALGLTLIGLAIGLVVAIAAAGALEPVLYRVSPRDPLVLAGVALTLLLVAAAAAAIPAMRAARIDPVTALRTE
jgi:predicted permease